MCLTSPLFHLLVKPHRETAGTFKVEHKGLPCVSNDVYFLIMKFPTQIPVQGQFLNASSNDTVFASVWVPRLQCEEVKKFLEKAGPILLLCDLCQVLRLKKMAMWDTQEDKKVTFSDPRFHKGLAQPKGMYNI